MDSETGVPGMILGAASLAALRLLLSKKGGGPASLRSSIAAAAVGAAVYPLLLCTFMGVAGARAFRDNHGWARFKLTFATYAQAAPTDSIPRGAVMGVFVAACRDLLRRRAGA